MRAEQADDQGANPSMVTPDAQKQLVTRPPLAEVEQPPDQSAQMAALYQMYASQVPQGDTYRSPMTLAARAMSATDQEATPGTSVNGGMPVMAELAAPVAQPQMQAQPPLANQAYPGLAGLGAGMYPNLPRWKGPR